ARHRCDADRIHERAAAIEHADVRGSARRVEVQRRGVHVALRIDRDAFRKIAGRAELRTEVADLAGAWRGGRRMRERDNECERGERHEFPHGSPPSEELREFSAGYTSRNPTNITLTPRRFVSSRIPDAPVNATVPPAATMKTPTAMIAFASARRPWFRRRKNTQADQSAPPMRTRLPTPLPIAARMRGS